jgi:hypothetical protein
MSAVTWIVKCDADHDVKIKSSRPILIPKVKECRWLWRHVLRCDVDRAAKGKCVMSPRMQRANVWNWVYKLWIKVWRQLKCDADRDAIQSLSGVTYDATRWCLSVKIWDWQITTGETDIRCRVFKTFFQRRWLCVQISWSVCPRQVCEYSEESILRVEHNNVIHLGRLSPLHCLDVISTYRLGAMTLRITTFNEMTLSIMP